MRFQEHWNMSEINDCLVNWWWVTSILNKYHLLVYHQNNKIAVNSVDFTKISIPGRLVLVQSWLPVGRGGQGCGSIRELLQEQTTQKNKLTLLDFLVLWFYLRKQASFNFVPFWRLSLCVLRWREKWRESVLTWNYFQNFTL